MEHGHKAGNYTIGHNFIREYIFCKATVDNGALYFWCDTLIEFMAFSGKSLRVLLHLVDSLIAVNCFLT